MLPAGRPGGSEMGGRPGGSEMGSGEREGPPGPAVFPLPTVLEKLRGGRGRACSLERQVPPGDRAPSMPRVTPDHSQRMGRYR